MESNEIKLTADEQAEMLELNNEYQNVLIDLGQVQMTRLKLNQELERTETSETECRLAYTEIEKRELNFRKRLVKKYGDGEIDAHTGVFTQVERNSN